MPKKKPRATEAEKFMYIAIFKAGCALSCSNLEACDRLLNEALKKMNVEKTYIAQEAFGIGE